MLDPRETQDDDPARPLWRGTVETAPLRLRVLPRDADTTRCEIPTAVAVGWNEERKTLEWSWAPDSWETAEIVSRPGYDLGCEMEFRWFLGDEPFPTLPPNANREEQREFRDVWGMWITGSLGGPPRRETPPGGAGGHPVGGPRFREVMERGEPIRLIVRAQIFETSEPSKHLWTPKMGDYRVLREWEIAGEWP